MSQEVNSFNRLLVVDDLLKKGITDYAIQPGNNCVWVSYDRVNCYYIVRDGQIADVQYD